MQKGFEERLSRCQAKLQIVQEAMRPKVDHSQTGIRMHCCRLHTDWWDTVMHLTILFVRLVVAVPGLVVARSKSVSLKTRN